MGLVHSGSAILLCLGLAATGVGGCASAGVAVTGKNTKDPSWYGSQSETAISVANFDAKSVVAIAFNDGTNANGKIVYTATTRTVMAGATLMGWAYSEDHGGSWHYDGAVPTTDEWPVLWGDPAITSSQRDQKYVFMSNLAVPASKLPAAGIDGYLGPYIGGACIARSTNGGKAFSLYQCVHDNFAFYDGGSMASTTGGDIYAAFLAVDSDRIDVWHAPGENAQFVELSNPFPGCAMIGHPRLRVGYPALTLGGPDPSLFVAAQIQSCDSGALDGGPGGFGQVIINRFHKGQWGKPRVASNPAVVQPDVLLSDRKLRTGPQFAFDVGAPSINGNDHIRMLVTRRDEKSGRLYIEGSFCRFDLSAACKPAPEWGSTPGYFGYQGDQFNPNVRAFPGVLTIPPVWAATFVSRDEAPSGNTVIIRRGAPTVLPDDSRSMVAFKLADQGLVCSDTRGYWGDYDDLQFIGFVKNTTTVQFLRAFTDSSAGCIERLKFESRHVHVRGVTFP